MRRFVLLTGIFLLLVFISDRVIGYSLHLMSVNSHGGYIGHQNYILNESIDDILIFGSSRAIHHYNAQLMQDSLGVTAYNCGQDGEGIIMFYGWWQVIKDRHHPKVIIYELMPEYDIYQGDNTKHLGWLKGIYDNPSVREEFDEIDSKEKYKMMSYLYRYNSRFHQILLDYFHPIHTMNKGFLPVYRDLDSLQVRVVDKSKGEAKSEMLRVDSLKIHYFERLFESLGDTKIVFFCSPTWYSKVNKTNESLDCFLKILSEHNCDFYDYSHDSCFVHQDSLFYDGGHMNYRGADLYTNRVIKILRDNYLDNK